MIRMHNIALAFAVVLSAAQARAAEPAGRAVIVRGAVRVQAADGAPRTLGPGDVVYPTETLITDVDGHVRLLMQDKSVLDLGPRSNMRINDYAVGGGVRKVSIKVSIGRLWARVRTFVGAENHFSVEGANAVAGVRGTELIFEVDDKGQVFLSVIDGSVELQSLISQAAEVIGAMQQGTATAGGIQISAVQEEALKSLLGSLKPGQALSSEERSNVLAQLGAIAGSGDQGGLEERLTEMAPDFSAPTLDLDPGQTGGLDTVINGRIVVEP